MLLLSFLPFSSLPDVRTASRWVIDEELLLSSDCNYQLDPWSSCCIFAVAAEREASSVAPSEPACSSRERRACSVRR